MSILIAENSFHRTDKHKALVNIFAYDHLVDYGREVFFAVVTGDLINIIRSRAENIGDLAVALAAVGVDNIDIPAATALISGVLADIDRNGVPPDEFLDAKERFRSWAVKVSNAGVSNEEFVSICTANYLYGASMASRKEVEKFFRGRRISLEQDLSMFNRFVSALIDPRRNLTVRYGTPSDTLDTEALRKIFQDSWKNTPPATAYRVKSADSLSLYYPVDKKMKIKITL